MPKVLFLPERVEIESDAGTKILVVAKRAKVDIRFGCASCKCGTCAVKVSDTNSCLPMQQDEEELLTKLNLSTAGLIRLSCRARVQSDVTVDLEFQNTYDASDFF